MTSLRPQKVVASFDSATALHAGLTAALRGESFRDLGQSAAAAAATRVAGRLPWPMLRGLYTRIGASEGLDPQRLGGVDLGAVARWLVDGIPQRPYPAVMIGSSNGALSHLAAALQIPWLPGTILAPVTRQGDPHQPIDALRFGERFAPALLDANPDVTLHHMHDQVQDELMVARMTYFRLKWRRLPTAYRQFLGQRLTAGGPIIVIEDESTWPVTQVADRHVFQAGAQGGRAPDYYLSQPHTPTPDGDAPEAEWGADPGLGESVAQWARTHNHPLVRVRFTGPQAPSDGVAQVLREWYVERGEPADRLVVPSFVLGDPWTTVSRAIVPFWTFFGVQPALASLDAHLAGTRPYRSVDIMLFQHGVRSPGIAEPDAWLEVARAHGAQARLLGLDPSLSPHDIATIARYASALRKLPQPSRPWTPLDVHTALSNLHGRQDVKVVKD